MPEQIRVGFVGAGRISKLHLDGIARHPDRMQIVALCDPDEANRKALATQCPNASSHTNVDDMIAKADLDVAVICTPTHIRKEVILPLIEAKIPVFCEKPFAETYAEALQIEQAAGKSGVPVAINQNFRRHFCFDIARQILSRGELGKPLHLTQSTAYLRNDAGWRLDRHRYVMSVMSIHWFDGYRYILGEEPETVYCRTVNSPATKGGDDTATSLILTFGSGTVVSLSESFSSFTQQNSCILDCEKGTLDIRLLDLTEIHQDGRKIEHKNPFDKPEATYYLLDDLINAVAEARQPETSASDNIKSMRILEAAYCSMRENRVVEIKEIK